MTNEELLEDLKQFITTTTSQRTSALEQRLTERLEILDEKMDLIQEAIAETVAGHQGTTNTTLQDHEKRLRRLERRTV